MYPISIAETGWYQLESIKTLEIKPTIYLREAATTGNQGRCLLGRANDLVAQCKPPLAQADARWDMQNGKNKWYGI